jgi:hypothetical protein
MSAARAPFSSRIALVTMVVACDRSPTSAGATAQRRIATSSALSTPAAGSAGVVGTLATPIQPLFSSTSATSVNVPPMSTPIRQLTPAPPSSQRIYSRSAPEIGQWGWSGFQHASSKASAPPLA